MGANTNDRFRVNGTVATVAVARGVSNPAEEAIRVRLRFAPGGGHRAKVERTYSEPTSVDFRLLICNPNDRFGINRYIGLSTWIQYFCEEVYKSRSLTFLSLT